MATPGPLSLSITALGEVAQGRFVPRTGVKPGDALFVSGTVGDAALGLRARRGEALPVDAAERAFLLDRYLHPQPRGVLAPAMAACASAGMDVSDGLVGDLTKMLRASGVSASVDLRKVPFSSAAASAIGADAAWFDAAVTGGDDYELLASVALDNAGDFEAQSLRAGVKVTRIGEALAGEGPPNFIGLDGALRAFARGSYSHF